MFRRALVLASLVIGLSIGAHADAKPSKAVAAHDKKGKKQPPRSVGAPNSGHLEGAALLKGSRYLKMRQGSHSWALPEMVHLVKRASIDVAHKHPHSQMLVGDLSGKTGGALDGHNSHQTGRDADIAFYAMSSKGKPITLKHFVAFDANGKPKKENGFEFDDARNWLLVEALLKDEKANVRYIFIVNSLRARLLAYATKHHVNKELFNKAAAAMMSPDDADLHDDHMHVRIACPESMREVCVEESVAKGKPDAKDSDKADDAPGKEAPSADQTAAPPADQSAAKSE